MGWWCIQDLCITVFSHSHRMADIGCFTGPTTKQTDGCRYFNVIST